MFISKGHGKDSSGSKIRSLCFDEDLCNALHKFLIFYGNSLRKAGDELIFLLIQGGKVF